MEQLQIYQTKVVLLNWLVSKDEMQPRGPHGPSGGAADLQLARLKSVSLWKSSKSVEGKLLPLCRMLGLVEN